MQLNEAEMVEEITKRVTLLLEESRAGSPPPNNEGKPFFKCRSIEKEPHGKLYRTMHPYVGVKL